MRLIPALALAASAFALAACAGGGGSSSALEVGSISNGIGGCPITGVDNNPDNDCNNNGGGGGTVDNDDDDGDGIPNDEDNDGGTGSGGGGNPTDLSVGDTTIAFEGTPIVEPRAGTTSKSVLTSSVTATATATKTAILSGTKPPDLRFSIDTQTDTNDTWSVPVNMNEYLPGTNRPDIFNGGTPDENIGAGSNYREYRALGTDRDELLQVWAWDDSYGVQYRNASAGGEAKQQAWSFGGNATTNMPVGGNATYRGRFAATAKTWNWLPRDGADIDPNGLWQIQGHTAMQANFGSGNVTGTLTPETWTSFQAGPADYYTFDTTTNSGYLTESGTPVDPIAGPPYRIFYTTVGIAAKIDAPVGGNASTTYTGKANLSGEFVTGNNPVYGGFFGAGAAETTGIFAAYGVSPDPSGGMDGINDDRRGFISMSGTFNAKCTNPGGSCP